MFSKDDEHYWHHEEDAPIPRNGRVAPVSLDDYEGPEGEDEPVDPREEYDRDAGLSGYDYEKNWSF